jgi:hypothetical protein
MKKARLPDWPPSGRSKGLLVLRESALAISSRLNVDFDRDEDQLGVIWTYLAVLESGTVFEMSWRPDSAETGVSIAVDDGETNLTDLFNIVRELDLPNPSAVSWLSPEVIWWRMSG